MESTSCCDDVTTSATPSGPFCRMLLLTESGIFTAVGGTLTNTGSLRIAPNATLFLGPSPSYSFVQSSGSLDIQGTLRLNNQRFVYNGGAISGTVTLGGVSPTLVLPTLSPSAASSPTFLSPPLPLRFPSHLRYLLNAIYY